MKSHTFLKIATSTLALGAAAAALPAFAQSTGSADFDGDAIIVTGGRINDIVGVRTPDSPKAKVEIGKEFIASQRAGQSVNEIINLVPGVSFTNNDPWGSSGGSFTIRGFDSSRIAQTFDGIPLNDSGNYAVYSNQQVDAEIIETVNVNLGSTDVDTPTAAAVGGTVNINTKVPDDQFGVMTSLSYGDIAAKDSGGEDRSFQRYFAKVETGEFTSIGTKAYFTGSFARNGATFANYGKVQKKQFNTKIYQPIGDNGDFISLSGHYNENRNNFGGSPLRASAFNSDKSSRFYEVAGGIPCTVSQTSVVNSCGTSFERRYNPSNTGNVRLASLFTLTDKLTLSVDAAYQYTKANGGGTTSANEGLYTRAAVFNTTTGALITPAFSGTGNYGGAFYFGRDLNGDGAIGQVTLVQPSQTKTNRYVAIANLSYELNDTNRVRLSYSFDRAHHRQTGAAGFLKANGEPFDVFPVNDPLTDRAGNVLQKRDRDSYATLHQIAGEYRGDFLNDQLTVLVGVRAPFFKRDLTQNCFTTSSGGFVDCVPADQQAAYIAARPYSFNATTGRASGAALPGSRKLDYDKILPNVGAVFKITPEVSIAGSYAKNLSVPSTDALYNAFYFPADSDAAYRVPESSNSFDASLRYSTPVVQASITGWYSKYKNRLVTAYDIDGNGTDTNLGPVKKYGVDASFSVRPVQPLSLYVFGSWIKSEIQNDAVTGSCAATSDIALAGLCYNVAQTDGTTISYLRTAGKRERAAPEWLFGGRAQVDVGDFQFGAQAKYTSDRFLNDINGEVETVTVAGAPKIIAPGGKFKAYTVVDLNVRYNLESLGLAKSQIQLNVSNLFDEYYVGSFSGGLDTLASSTSAFVNFGSPRAISATFIMGF
ncbi:TonB-dependent receptor [Novosphingobium sp. P6W]|uniref:TonB-dependent receptor n=1 Tax=Novosphingobium sp. P6W TaxID=1609758 RepID=UPI0005C31F5C|nr:TonB-dependent receptor [Novosphingobium sp. P6W]AXB76163.1 TonB-dependent receptor [Novosphingobium sp. P6W]KIS31458.1 TonB-dependent receptor [Novosphingobium sp. P6W]